MNEIDNRQVEKDLKVTQSDRRSMMNRGGEKC